MTVGTGQRTVSKWCDYPERSKYLCKTHLLTEMLAYIAAITQPKAISYWVLGTAKPHKPIQKPMVYPKAGRVRSTSVQYIIVHVIVSYQGALGHLGDT